MEDTTISSPGGESDNNGVATDTEGNSGWTSASDEDENKAITPLREASEMLNNLTNRLQILLEQRGSSLNNLANAFQTQFQQQGDPKYIDEAITLHREALEMYAAPHPDRGMSETCNFSYKGLQGLVRP
ncbi:hypothetical protein C8J57DRAFT_1312612 [Mycena rebaudengoi]|nr:hypothetical protein C8J57DRAFT_563492 [Mycena rebaudengoi]KAJ7274727.1 hypothetical protein C8J57DRAFT_1312612 [Mycena rebaudengoi]